MADLSHLEVDLLFRGREQAICTHVLGDLLVDPGPSTCIETLLAGLPDGYEPRAILLTHIHLDHAGAAGKLVRDHWPRAEVWVHERGARHMADPSRLIAGATALYGDDMDRLWGEIAPIPQENLVVLAGGEARDGLRVAYTPGHAKHHVSYLHEASGIAFVGDTLGIRIEGGAVLPPTPPPDIDIDAWRASVEEIEGWRAGTAALTHFGSYRDLDDHVALLRDALDRFAAAARAGDRDAFEAVVAELRSGDDRYLAALPPEYLWAGVQGWIDRAG